MYIIYSKDLDLDHIQSLFEGINEDIRVFDSQEYDEDSIMDFIEKNSKEVRSIAYLGIDETSIKKVSRRIVELNPDTYQIAIVENGHKALEEDARLDEIYLREELVGDSIINEFEKHDFKRKSRELQKVISSSDEGLSIYIHDDPDMDAISSAFAFERICDEAEIKSTTYYAGSIGPTETGIFLENSDFLINKIDPDSVDRSLQENEKIVFLDFADPSQSDTIPDDVTPDIIIDHHVTNKDVIGREYTEIRTDVGAVATLMTQHILNLDIEISPILASALLVGIKIDTKDYTKNIHTKDYRAMSYLSSVCDRDILDVLENPPIYSETFTAMGSAIFNRRIKEEVLTTFCQEVHHREDISQIADLLLRESDILTVLVYGVKDDNILMSARSKDLTSNMGKIMESAFSDIGEAGGHPHAAGGKISLDKFDDIVEASERIENRFHDEVFDR